MSAKNILTFCVAALFLGCSSHEELPPPDNPFDPGNPDYVSPHVELDSGPVEGQIIQSTIVTFEWRGNESATEYSYKLDDSEWSAWTMETVSQFDYLDEGDHQFSVKAKSINGEEQLSPTIAEFNVDAMHGPAALIYPFMQSGSPGDTLTYHVVTEEVADLFAVECEIELDDRVELIEISNGDLIDEWGGTPVVMMESQPRQIDLSITSVGGTNTAFTGSSTLISIDVRIKPGSTVNNLINAIIITDMVYLTPSLEGFEPQELRPGVLDVH